MDRSVLRNAGARSRRRRACQACTECRTRKIRCNLPERQPCSNCLASNRSCKAVRQVNALSDVESALPVVRSHVEAALQGNTTSSIHDSTDIDGWLTRSGHQTVQRPTCTRPQGAASGADATPVSPQSARQPTVSGDEEVWARMIENPENTALEEPSGPLDAVSTRQNDGPQHKCVKFRGESMAHSMLPHMEGHTELSLDASEQIWPSVDRALFYRSNPPKSTPPAGKCPWMHASCNAHINLLGHLPKEDQYYIFSIKKAFSFPPRSIAGQLLVIFFESVYPLMPIFNRKTVLQLYEAIYTNKPSSPLVFHAIFFTACHFADPSLLLGAGFNSVFEAKVYFFHRAKVLYFHDCEPDHMFVLQALILMTFWWMDYAEEKDMRFWASCAVNLAMTMGMNKARLNAIGVSPTQEAVWRRIFWILFVSNLERRKPVRNFSHGAFLFLRAESIPLPSLWVCRSFSTSKIVI